MRIEQPPMSLTTFLRREIRVARLRPALSGPFTLDDPPPEADSEVFEFFQLPHPAHDPIPFDQLPPTHHYPPGSWPAPADPDILEIPPAVIARFVFTLADGDWPVMREGQVAVVDMVATLSLRADCRRFGYLRLM